MTDIELIEDVLAGRLTPENDPAVFADEILHFSVRAVETDNEAWLLRVLQTEHPGKRHVVSHLSRRLRNIIAPAVFGV